MAKGLKGGIKSARSKGIRGLAWSSMFVALAGGPLVAGTFVGDAIDTVLSAIPWVWMPPVLLGLMFVVLVLDLVVDGEPNHPAVWMLLVMPSVARATPGELGDRIGEWTGSALDLVAAPLREWLGTGSPIALAVFLAATALLLARKTVKRPAAGA